MLDIVEPFVCVCVRVLKLYLMLLLFCLSVTKLFEGFTCFFMMVYLQHWLV